ncbi:MAG TPA: 30S ribosomal protein S6 [Candidatus Paceibacterota bacterium]|nr:30S ribosomal protein S6 [Candidatus Paceibacterota bacterium]
MKFMEVMQVGGENEISGGVDSKVYELGYLLVPTIKEEDVAASYGNLKELVSSFAGEIIGDEMPKMINLAYSMQKITSNVRHKWNTAYFGWTKFLMDPQKVLELKKRLDLDPNFIRFLILKTVKENTIAVKRFVRGDTYKRPKSKSIDSETAVPINQEEIDKEIDALVAV